MPQSSLSTSSLTHYRYSVSVAPLDKEQLYQPSFAEDAVPYYCIRLHFHTNSQEAWPRLGSKWNPAGRQRKSTLWRHVGHGVTSPASARGTVIDDRAAAMRAKSRYWRLYPVVIDSAAGVIGDVVYPVS